MKTKLLAPTPEGLRAAAAILRAGGLVAFPTETVYGLGADATNAAAIERLFAAKGRPSTNPVIVHVPDADGARRWAADWPPLAAALAGAFWPGPLTLVVESAPAIADAVRAGGSTVGLRAPDHTVARALLAQVALPIAAPSANRSGMLSPVTAAHVLAQLDGSIDAVIDGGGCRVGIESTVVDCTGAAPRVLRPGMIDAASIARVAGGLPTNAAGQPDSAAGVARSPGLLDRHYAPRTPLRLAWRGEIEAAPSDVGVLALGHFVRDGATVRVLPADPARYAAGLYAALHELDARGLRAILVERPPEGDAWQGVHDRLRRASFG